MNFRRPSTTIQNAAIAGAASSLLWEVILQFGVQLRPGLVSAGTAFIAALVGYISKEKVLKKRYGGDSVAPR